MNRFLVCSLTISLLACSGSSSIESPDALTSSILSGTIKGLEGVLVLQNNVGEKITISKNGTFDFTTILNPNSDFTLKVLEEPCAQRCTLDHTSGKVTSDGKINLSIDCGSKAWTLPNSLADNISFSSSEVTGISVAMNQYGDSIVTWAQPDATGQTRLYKTEYRNRSWLSPSSDTDYFSFVGGDALDHDTAINAQGETYIGWLQGDGIFNQAYIAQYLDDRWIYPSSISDRMSIPGSDVISGSNAFVVRANDKGDMVAAWIQEEGSDRQVFKSSYKDGVWTFPESIADNISPDEADDSISNVDLALNQNGDYVIVWDQSNGSDNQIFKFEYRNGIASYPTSLSTNISESGSSADNPKVAMDDEGNTIIVWYQYDAETGGHRQIFKSEYRDGNWNHPDSLTDNISANGLDAYYPAVAMNNLGHAILVWKQKDSVDGHQQVYKKEFVGGVWESAVQISPSGTNTYKPVVSLDEQDNALISWKQESVDGSNIFHMMKSEYRGGHWTHPSSVTDQISPGSTDTSTADVVANNCRMRMVWRQKNVDDVYQTFMAEYR